MRYFIDTEFDWQPLGCIVPISVGIVAEDGREFYAVVNHIDRMRHSFSQFVREHVWPRRFEVLASHILVDVTELGDHIRGFIGNDDPQFWGEFSAFDYVVLSMSMGEFEDWPQTWPMWINDLKQDAIPEHQSEIPHNALADARAIRDAYNWAFQVGR